jgi:hypothetical protein
MKGFCLLLVALALVGCNSGPALQVKQVPDQLPGGWTLAMSDDNKARLAVPHGWRQGVDRMMDPTGMGDIGDLTSFANMQGGDPQMSQAMSELGQMAKDLEKMSEEAEREALAKLAEKGIILNVIYVGGRPTPGETRTRFFVQHKSFGGNVSMEKAAKEESGFFFGRPEFQSVQLPIGEALYCKTTDKMRDGSEMHKVSYVVVNGKDMYSLRFVTQEPETVITSIAEQVAQTLRIAP